MGRSHSWESYRICRQGRPEERLLLLLLGWAPLGRASNPNQLSVRPSRAGKEASKASMAIHLGLHHEVASLLHLELQGCLSSKERHSLQRQGTWRARQRSLLLPEPTVALVSRMLLAGTQRVLNRQTLGASPGQLWVLLVQVNKSTSTGMRLLEWVKWHQITGGKLNLQDLIHIRPRSSISGLDKVVDSSNIHLPTKCSPATRACFCSSTINANWTTRSA